MKSLARQRTLLIALVLTMCIPSAAHGADDDPFARANRAQPALSPASKKLPTLIDFKVTVEPPRAKPGTVVQLTITGTLKPGYHTYPLLERRSRSNVD